MTRLSYCQSVKSFLQVVVGRPVERKCLRLSLELEIREHDIYDCAVLALPVHAGGTYMMDRIADAMPKGA